MLHMKYCKFGNFRENFIFANSVKRHICDVKNSRLRHDIPISVNDRVISPFREDFVFTKLRENKTLAKISEFTVGVKIRGHKESYPVVNFCILCSGVVDLLFIVTPIVGVRNCSMFCCTLLYVNLGFAITLMGKSELVPLLILSSWCLMIVV